MAKEVGEDLGKREVLLPTMSRDESKIVSVLSRREIGQT
ncbi:hypothetical protein DSM25558_2264 [Agrobacterium sp. DSM 25558]|nr:hypothetical protein DSM25558_2264 [Agrobacterium sp. DSM 25558]